MSTKAGGHATKTKKTRILFPLAMMAILYGISSLPGTPKLDDPAVFSLLWLPPTLQNALHVPAYAALVWAWWWGLEDWIEASAIRFVIGFMIALVFGIFDEWHQSFVPGRYASLTDVVLNIAGALAGIALTALVVRYRSADRR